MTTATTPDRHGRWAVVTGASSGIGLAHAHELAARGFDIVLVGRHEERLAHARDELARIHGVTAEQSRVDLAEPDGAEQVLAHLGSRDVGVLVTVAGSGSPGQFLDTPLAVYLDCVNVKVRNNLVLLHHVAAAMSHKRAGAIIVVSSTGGLHGVPGLSNNAGTEAYLLSMSEALHHELAPAGVKVLGLMPGLTRTPGAYAMIPEHKMPRTAQTPQAVARESLRALERGKVTHISGVPNRVLLTLLPRRARTALYRRMVSGVMTAGATSAPPTDGALAASAAAGIGHNEVSH